MNVCGRDIRIHGRLVRIAALDADKYQYLDNPEPFLEGLRKCGRRIDLFTFLQGLPAAAPKYPYPMELDNLAAIPISTFEHWWTQQIASFKRGRPMWEIIEKGYEPGPLCLPAEKPVWEQATNKAKIDG